MKLDKTLKKYKIKRSCLNCLNNGYAIVYRPDSNYHCSGYKMDFKAIANQIWKVKEDTIIKNYKLRRYR